LWEIATLQYDWLIKSQKASAFLAATKQGRKKLEGTENHKKAK